MSNNNILSKALDWAKQAKNVLPKRDSASINPVLGSREFVLCREGEGRKSKIKLYEVITSEKTKLITVV